MQNHFDLFQLPQRFALDAAALDAAFREVQGQVHPDRFVQAGDMEKRVAMQWATQANEAYQTLKNPLKRAAYLCELNGVDLKSESNTAMPSAFLIQQMEWREALQEARVEKNETTLESLGNEWRSARQEHMKQIEARLDAQDYALASQSVREWMFLEKFGEELRNAYETLEN
jgi:molecular chaperone HscB